MRQVKGKSIVGSIDVTTLKRDGKWARMKSDNGKGEFMQEKEMEVPALADSLRKLKVKACKRVWG